MIRPVDQHCRERGAKSAWAQRRAIYGRATQQPWPSAPPHSCSPAAGLLTTLSRAPLLKEGWKVMSWAWAPSSPWIMPLDEEEKGSRQLEAAGRNSGMWVWYGRASEEPSTYQGSSSNTGLFRVRKRRMTGFPFWTRGLPVRDGRGTGRNSRPNPRTGAQQNCCQDTDTLDYWEDGTASRGLPLHLLPFMSTASRSPLGSQTMEWASPPSL